MTERRLPAPPPRNRRGGDGPPVAILAVPILLLVLWRLLS